MLYKVKPVEFPAFEKLRTTRIVDYVPAWRQAPKHTESQPSEAPQENPAADRDVESEKPIQMHMPEYAEQAESTKEPAHSAQDGTATQLKGNLSYTVIHDRPEELNPKTSPQSTIAGDAEKRNSAEESEFETLTSFLESTLDEMKTKKSGNGN